MKIEIIRDRKPIIIKNKYSRFCDLFWDYGFNYFSLVDIKERGFADVWDETLKPILPGEKIGYKERSQIKIKRIENHLLSKGVRPAVIRSIRRQVKSIYLEDKRREEANFKEI